VRLLAPIFSSKVVCVGRNYADHAAELGNEVPKEPLIFLKPSTSVIGPNDAIRLPPQSKQVEHEAELAVVIGVGPGPARRLDRAAAAKVIFGYTCANDVTARDLQKADVQFTRAKGFDSFCPLGPWIVTGLDVSDLEVRCEVSDEVRQIGRTKDMVFDVATLVSYVSHVMTLLPGDVILTGTPAGVGPLTAGDTVTVRVEGIGDLTNPVTTLD
jgi:2-keto-4-pentenoate hydratase/2-oxohepta-3-ene-1,7-dioic acid hydratase in catechol pathway